jgi:hypothetical protein
LRKEEKWSRTAGRSQHAINFPAANKVEGGLRRALIILSIRHANLHASIKQRVIDHGPLAIVSQQIVEGALSAAKTIGEPGKNFSRLLKNCVGLASDLDFDSAGRLGSDC